MTSRLKTEKSLIFFYSVGMEVVKKQRKKDRKRSGHKRSKLVKVKSREQGKVSIIMQMKQMIVTASFVIVYHKGEGEYADI